MENGFGTIECIYHATDPEGGIPVQSELLVLLCLQQGRFDVEATPRDHVRRDL